MSIKAEINTTEDSGWKIPFLAFNLDLPQVNRSLIGGSIRRTMPIDWKVHEGVLPSDSPEECTRRFINRNRHMMKRG